ncbi:MAG: hypothetical protein OEY18_02005 [Candidatus Aminicenantes bacterium]|nr:hypothetical protein [Candidatus Aminicenantes bacterium]MDH5383454.1 hypothetical protein [Candidatus Aminicenantes bacterium]MDH5744838.1 hypothetical protein [Candidatus Aminicenantes bacterium]
MRNLSFQAKLGFVSPSENYIHSSLTGGLGIVLPIKGNVSFSLDLGFWKSSVDEKPNKFYEGKMTLIPFLASFRYSLLPDKTINPYAYIGTGYVITRFKMENIITLPEITIDQKIKNGLCVHAGAGTDVRISESCSVTAEGFYFSRKTKGTTTISDMNVGVTSEEFSVRLNAFIFQIGVKYFFK